MIRQGFHSKTIGGRKDKDALDALPVHRLLEYVRSEITVLQSRLRAQQTLPQEFSGAAGPQQQPANDAAYAGCFGLLAFGEMFFGLLLEACFEPDTLASFGGLLSGETLAAMLGGLIVMSDSGGRQNLQPSFILSLYPQGRKNVQMIMETMRADPLRRAAGHSFITPAEAEHQMKILAETERNLDMLSRCNIVSVMPVCGRSLYDSLNIAARNAGQQSRRAF